MHEKAAPWIILILTLSVVCGIVLFQMMWKQDHPVVVVPLDDALHHYVDNDTGCQYIGTRYGLSIRLGKDGKPLCP